MTDRRTIYLVRSRGTEGGKDISVVAFDNEWQAGILVEYITRAAPYGLTGYAVEIEEVILEPAEPNP